MRSPPDATSCACSAPSRPSTATPSREASRSSRVPQPAQTPTTTATATHRVNTERRLPRTGPGHSGVVVALFVGFVLSAAYGRPVSELGGRAFASTRSSSLASGENVTNKKGADMITSASSFCWGACAARRFARSRWAQDALLRGADTSDLPVRRPAEPLHPPLRRRARDFRIRREAPTRAHLFDGLPRRGEASSASMPMFSAIAEPEHSFGQVLAAPQQTIPPRTVRAG